MIFIDDRSGSPTDLCADGSKRCQPHGIAVGIVKSGLSPDGLIVIVGIAAVGCDQIEIDDSADVNGQRHWFVAGFHQRGFDGFKSEGGTA